MESIENETDEEITLKKTMFMVSNFLFNQRFEEVSVKCSEMTQNDPNSN